jgi:hypothetical protein
MKNKFKLAVFAVAALAWFEAAAQSIAPQVLSNCGATISNANYHMDWTFGEFAIATIGNSQYDVTQGFHQPYSGTVGIEEGIQNGASSWIWPNPANGELNLGVTRPFENGTMARVLGMDGKMLLSFIVAPGKSTTVIPIDALAGGSYLLVIENADGIARTHRFIKTP